jgi:hypothetical protein
MQGRHVRVLVAYNTARLAGRKDLAGSACVSHQANKSTNGEEMACFRFD